MLKLQKIICVLLVLAGQVCIAQKEMRKIENFGTNPGNLVFYLYQPKKLTDKMPLVVALHGCNQDVATISKQSGWNKLADENGFLVIYPQQRFLNNPSSCFNWYNEKDISKNSGESGSIKEMIDFVCDSFAVDKSKIFAYGLSAGAAMTSALLADYPETFNAGAVLAGGPFRMATNPLNGVSAMISPKHRSSREWGELVLKENPGYKNKFPRVVIVHGKNDNVVDIKNAYELIKQWAYVLHTDTMPAKKAEAFGGGKDVARLSYLNKQQEEEIIFYEIGHLGHALPVDPGTTVDKGGQTGLFAVDKDFFSTYWIAKDFGILK